MLASYSLSQGANGFEATHPGATPAQVRAALIDAGSPGPITGDPDLFPEPVLNVAGF